MSKRWTNPFESAWFCSILAIIAGYNLYEVWDTKHKVDLISAVYFTCCAVLLFSMRKKIVSAIIRVLNKDSKNEAK